MLFKTLLVIHIAAGTTALLTGPLAVLVKKGGRAHRNSGTAFFYAMLAVAATALIMGYLHNIPFLMAVGIFSTYMNVSGYRVLYQKRRDRLHETDRVDWFVSGTMALASLYFLLYGIYILVNKDLFGLVFIAFAQSSVRMLWQDWNLFIRRDIQPHTWLKFHLTRMLGTCIAAYTALLVVNSASRLSLVGWLLPTLIGVPVIVYWLRKIKPKPVEVAEVADETLA
jgi:uncharacterized membrane protein